jgi:TRAP-type transport system small permease protein
MWAARISTSLGRTLKPINLVLYAVAGVALMAMMLIVAVDVGLRNLINVPLTGAFDLTTYMMGITVVFGLAYCQMENAHINTDVLVNKLPKQPKLLLAALVLFVSVVFTAVITWQCFVNMGATVTLGLQSNILHIPVFPFLGATGVGFLLYSLELLKSFFDVLAQEVVK